MNMFFMNDTENRTIQYTLYKKNPAVLRKAIRDGWKKKITPREHAVILWIRRIDFTIGGREVYWIERWELA